MSGNKKKHQFPKLGTYTYYTAVLCAAAYIWISTLPLAAQSKSPSYAASGAFTTTVDNYMNPAGFSNINFDTLFAFTAVNSRYLDLGAAARFGRVYTALSYSANVFDYTGIDLMALNIIKPARIPLPVNNEPGNLKSPAFSNKGTILIGIKNVAAPPFKNLGFKFSIETVSKKNTKQELYGTHTLTVQPKNPANPLIFEFKDGNKKTVTTEGTDKSSLKMVFDWGGFQMPIQKRTLTIKPYFALDLNKNITKAETNKEFSYTKGLLDHGNTELKCFLNGSYGDFNLGYNFFYKFFPDMPENFIYTFAEENAGTHTKISAKQTTEQTGRRDMLHKISSGYKPMFKFANNTVILRPGLTIPFEVRTVITPHTLKTTETAKIKTGAVNEVIKTYIKEYGTYSKEIRMTFSPALSAGVQYRIIKNVLTLNAGTNIQMNYTHSIKNTAAPEIEKVTATLKVDNSGTEIYRKTTENSKVQNGTYKKDEFNIRGFFGIGLQWNINRVLSFDSAYTVNTDFKNAAATLEKSALNVCLSVKL